jgi:hypothetical protein
MRALPAAFVGSPGDTARHGLRVERQALVYVHHGKCNKKSMALLVCICGVSRLLRILGHSYVDDAAACDADILHLLVRMQLYDGRQLLQAVSDHHRHM